MEYLVKFDHYVWKVATILKINKNNTIHIMHSYRVITIR